MAMDNNFPLSISELNHYTNLWCREKGIHAIDLEKHKQADDVVLLVLFREQFWRDMTKAQQGSWAAFWSYSYTHKKPLKQKHLKKLENISYSAINTRHFKEIQKAEQRQRIKALRQNTTVATQNPKPADNMTAKDAGLLQTVPWE